MASGHNNIKRLLHRTGEELHATKVIASRTSWPQALNTLHAKVDIQIMSRNGYKEPPAVKARLLHKHDTVIYWLENCLGDYCEAYDYDAPLSPSDPSLENKIWMCWWQGIDNAPDIVRRCVDSVRRNAGGREVIIITNNNMDQYVQIPGWFLELSRNRVVSRTHLSDLLRMSLLAEHGGMWLDATFYCVGPLEGGVYDAPLWTIKRPDYLHASVACGQFANYSLGCDTENRRIFATIRDFYLEYWRREKFLVDYLLTDYLIVLAAKYDSKIAKAFSEVVSNNPKCDELIKVLGEPFNQAKWDSLKSDTDLFKLTWKQQFPFQDSGMETFYKRLLDGQL